MVWRQFGSVVDVIYVAQDGSGKEIRPNRGRNIDPETKQCLARVGHIKWCSWCGCISEWSYQMPVLHQSGRDKAENGFKIHGGRWLKSDVQSTPILAVSDAARALGYLIIVTAQSEPYEDGSSETWREIPKRAKDDELYLQHDWRRPNNFTTKDGTWFWYN